MSRYQLSIEVCQSRFRVAQSLSLKARTKYLGKLLAGIQSRLSFSQRMSFSNWLLQQTYTVSAILNHSLSKSASRGSKLGGTGLQYGFEFPVWFM